MPESPIILFDGVCNLCDGFVQFVIRHDATGQFRFTSLQSTTGAEILKKYHIPPGELSSIVLSVGDSHFTRSDAALQILRCLSGPWKWMGLFLVLPRFLRDAVYDFIARNRYRWFGQKDACMIPTAELQKRFL